MFSIDRKELIRSLLVAGLFMGLGLIGVDRMIGDPAAFPPASRN